MLDNNNPKDTIRKTNGESREKMEIERSTLEMTIMPSHTETTKRSPMSLKDPDRVKTSSVVPIWNEMTKRNAHTIIKNSIYITY
jgi:hypothetical protein